MTDNVAIYTNGAGELAIVIPANNVYVPEKGPVSRSDFLTFEGAAPAGYVRATIEQIAARDVPSGFAWSIKPRTAFPAKRTFRNAWKHAGEAIEVDMPKARDIQRDRLRALREPLLARLDVESMKASEANNNPRVAAVAAQKRALRDITTHADIASATTPEQLEMAAFGVLAGVETFLQSNGG